MTDRLPSPHVVTLRCTIAVRPGPDLNGLPSYMSLSPRNELVGTPAANADICKHEGLSALHFEPYHAFLLFEWACSREGFGR